MQKILILAILTAFITGCASPQVKTTIAPDASLPQPNVEVVARTLRTYQVGKTTIEDFIHDAELKNATFPSRSPLDPPSPPNFLVRCMFRTRSGSPWRIYGTRVDQTSHNGGLSVERTRIYEVGDINKPICYLTFGNDGKLTNISPAP